MRVRHLFGAGSLLVLGTLANYAQDCSGPVKSAEAQLTRAAAMVRQAESNLNRDIQTMHGIGKGFDETAADFINWGNLSAESQQEAEFKALDAFISDALVGVDSLLKNGKSLNPWSVHEFLKTNNIQNRHLQQVYRIIARMQDKPALFPKLRKAVSTVETLHDAALMEQLSDIFSMVLEAPEYQLAASNISLVAADIHAAQTTYNAATMLARLRTLSEQERDSWASVNRAIQHHVAEIKAAKTTQAQAQASVKSARSFQTACLTRTNLTSPSTNCPDCSCLTGAAQIACLCAGRSATDPVGNVLGCH